MGHLYLFWQNKADSETLYCQRGLHNGKQQGKSMLSRLQTIIGCQKHHSKDLNISSALISTSNKSAYFS